MTTSEQGPSSAAPDGPGSADDRQELRLAVTMTGGVSLAVWMGGVARELNLLCQASKFRIPPLTVGESATTDQRVLALYSQLLELVDVAVDIDVLSGTSAGGINAAVLGVAQANDRDLRLWREEWIALGSLQNLMRDPREKAPPSLLYGDQVMYAGLCATMARLQSSPPVNPPGKATLRNSQESDRSTSVFITTTLLTGEQSQFTDSYGTVVQDTDHHGMFTFRQPALEQALITTDGSELALAARSSASFPGAFEPSFVPFGETVPRQGKIPARPDMAGCTNISQPHWVADGGLLANRPLQPLLETIFDRTATVPVRRVLLYVIPTSDTRAANELSPRMDSVSAPLSMREALMKDVAAVLGQSITSDLRAIRDHNSNVDALSDSRLQLASLGIRTGQLPIVDLLDDYRKREGRALVEPVVTGVLELLSATSIGSETVPGQTISGVTTIEQRCRAAALESVTAQWHEEPADFDGLGDFGRPAYDGAKATVITMLRAAHDLAHGGQRQELDSFRRQIHAAFAGIVPRPDPQAILVELFGQTGVTKDPVACAAQAAAELGKRLGAASPDQQGGVPTLERTVTTATPLSLAWSSIGAALLEHQHLLQSLVAAVSPLPVESTGNAGPAQQLDTYLRYLFARVSDPAAPGTTPKDRAPGSFDVARRLFDLHIVLRALLPLTAEVEQPVEFVQLSADSRTLLDLTRNTAAKKLTGLQLQHFGSFYKASWRANDWMWGRVDGAGWLVHLLLEPGRLQEIAGRNVPLGRRRDWVLDRLTLIAGPRSRENIAPVGRPKQLLDETIHEELGYLDDPDRPRPISLPATALWVARPLQQWIAVDEIPYVAQQIQHDVTDGRARWRPEEQTWVAGTLDAAGLRNLQSPPPAGSSQSSSVALDQPRVDLLVAAFRENPVPAQTFATEVGQPLLARTVAQALATATSAGATATGNPTALKPFLSSLRGITLTAYQAISATKATTRSLVLSGLAMIVIGALVAIGFGTVVGLGGVIVMAAGLAVLSLGVWGRSWRALVVLGGCAFILLLALPIFPFVRKALFDPAPDDRGLLTNFLQSLPGWLAGTWWHAVTVIVGFIVLLALVITAAHGAGRRRGRKLATRQMAGIPMTYPAAGPGLRTAVAPENPVGLQRRPVGG